MLTAIGDVMREAYKRGWITSRDGNISILRQNNFYITPSGMRKTIIHPELVIKKKIPASKKLEDISWSESVKPSIEAEMHWMIQMNDVKTKSVVHLHPTYTVALMQKVKGTGDKYFLQKVAKDFPELKRYTRVGPIASYHEPGSKDLADSVFNAFVEDGVRKYDIVGMMSHGVTAVGFSPWDAFEHIERMEHISQIYLAMR